MIDASVGVPDGAGRAAYVIHVAKPLRAMIDAQNYLLVRHLAFALAMLVLVGLAVNLLTYRLLLKPIQRIQRRVRQAGWSAQEAASHGGDEVQRLELAIDQMLQAIDVRHEALRDALGEKDRLLAELRSLRDGLAAEVERVRQELSRAQAELIRNERMNLLSTLSSGLAHELRNPLHIVRGTAETVARRHPEVAPYVSDIMEEVDRIERLVRELLCYASSVEVSRESVDLRQLLERVMGRGCRRRDGAACSADACLIQVSGDAPTASADPVLLEQALLNLLTNACEAGGSPVEMHVEAEPDDWVSIRVLDRGKGIDSADRAHIFEPFFTRKAKGTGLGLPMVQRIAELHGGSIELKPRSGGGTEAVLRLPTGRETHEPGRTSQGSGESGSAFPEVTGQGTHR